MKAHDTAGGAVFAYKSNTMNGLMSYAQLSNGWLLGMFVPSAELYASIYTMAVSIVLLTALAIIIAVVISWLSARNVSRVIRELVEGIKAMENRSFVNAAAISQVVEETEDAAEQAFSAIEQLSFKSMENRENLTEALTRLGEMDGRLRQMVNEEIQRSRQKDAVMIYQARLANMGEIVGNIAHQWRQPLNGLNVILGELKDANRYGELDDAQFEQAIKSARRVTERMSQTIEDFMSYLSPSKNKKPFSIKNAIDFALEITGHTLRIQGIYPCVNIREDALVYGFENEFIQVLCNIISNARDALADVDYQEKRIEINVRVKEEFMEMTIFNSGMPIDDAVMDKLFMPFVTTKAPGKGTGIGLYMAKVMVEEHMKGEIRMENVTGGVLCRVRLPRDLTNR